MTTNLKAAGLMAVLAFLAAAPVPQNGAITVTGKLETGIMAIGGETTGITVNDGNTSYELDIKDAVLMRKANELNGKPVKVTGTLIMKAGVEVAQRRIIAVTALDSAVAVPTGPATKPATQPK